MMFDVIIFAYLVALAVIGLKTLSVIDAPIVFFIFAGSLTILTVGNTSVFIAGCTIAIFIGFIIAAAEAAQVVEMVAV
jgi:hypothetical protein